MPFAASVMPDADAADGECVREDLAACTSPDLFDKSEPLRMAIMIWLPLLILMLLLAMYGSGCEDFVS